MQQHGEIQPRIDEGIDRKTLNTLRKRFMAVNATRLRRVLHPSVAKSAAFSPDGTRLAAGYAMRFELPVLSAPAWAGRACSCSAR